ncbi:hypothetical protein Hanom_Chr04g00319601 [Helianthus anomalus]
MGKCISLLENNKILYEKIEVLKKDIAQLHRDVNQQQCWVHGYKHRLTVKTLECDSLKAELELLTGKYQQNELNIKKFDTSNDTVRNLCNVQLAFKENKGKDLRYTWVLPPYNHNYSKLPTTKQEMENYDKMIYGKPSDYVPWEPSKSKNGQPADFKKPMNFFNNENENCQNKLVDKFEHVNETETKTETETETKPVKPSAVDIEKSSLNSDSVDNTNCFCSCAESVRPEEKSKEDDESHQCVADNVISDKNDLYACNYVFSWFVETWGVPTKTDESRAVILDYGCKNNGCVENVFTGNSDVSTDNLKTSVSSNSEINFGDLGNYSSSPETSNDTSET